MVNSVGKKLQQARLSKQLSIEEVSRVTRIRPDKLLDLEDDNYSNFPSLSYAKGFLLIYARYLVVDVREFADSLHSSNPVSTDDYEYLNAAAEGPPPPPTRRPYHFAPRRERSLLPVVVFAVLTCVAGFVIYLVVSFQRLGNLEDIADKKDPSSPTASPAISTIPAATPAPATPASIAVVQSTPVQTPAATPTPVAISTPASPPPIAVAPAPIAAAPAPTAAIAAPPPNPPATFDPTREVRRAEPVGASPPPHADSSPAAALPPVGSGPAVTAIEPAASPTDAVKQVSILPIRKTMVTIRKDMADSAPIFEDWLYPGDGPLKVSGRKLWIQVQDPGAVQITQDGQPVPSGRSDIQIE